MANGGHPKPKPEPDPKPAKPTDDSKGPSSQSEPKR